MYACLKGGVYIAQMKGTFSQPVSPPVLSSSSKANSIWVFAYIHLTHLLEGKLIQQFATCLCPESPKPALQPDQ